MKHRDVLDEIDNYQTTVQAILGFVNFYRFDDDAKAFRSDVEIFQGRRFDPSPERKVKTIGQQVAYVCPDFAILVSKKAAVVGEVKKSFPKDQQHWEDDFGQVKSYDDDLAGWPTENEKVATHDLVMLVDQSRGVNVQEYYDTHKDELGYQRPFILVEFNRKDERQRYYYFRKCPGTACLSDPKIDKKLKYGVPVPMEAFVRHYSEIQLYDAEPPLPYMVYLIWEHVLLPRASDTPSFAKLRKNQKMEIDIKVAEIAEELNRGFSFRTLHGDNCDRQPQIPKPEWVSRACEKLVALEEAEWTDHTKVTIRCRIRKHDDVLEHFVEACSRGETPGQMSLPFTSDER